MTPLFIEIFIPQSLDCFFHQIHFGQHYSDLKQEMKTKRFRGDWYSKYLRHQIKFYSAEFRRQHRASLTDEDSDSYDAAQRCGAIWTTYESTLQAYIEFKTRSKK